MLLGSLTERERERKREKTLHSGFLRMAAVEHDPESRGKSSRSYFSFSLPLSVQLLSSPLLSAGLRCSAAGGEVAAVAWKQRQADRHCYTD